ncbi:MAG: TonB-dependent receptor [Alphaproteobacteria bacterium]|nr:TonB-dependent receptor [Alphaproteobacteria bacterium]PHX98394.1 MAG: TonB-dependent receptor [Rhodospirillaceae bacterium]
MKSRPTSIFLLAPVLLATTALAQPQSPIEEILVTARGRIENLARVPDSISVYGRAELEKHQVVNFEDIAAYTPGVFVINDQDPGTNIITIRGISTDRLQQASVAYVVDGLALADKELFTQPYYDMERVEILKGPQGALYGKNAIGGVFNVITRAPTETFEGSVEAEYGNGDNKAVRVAVGGPLMGKKLMFRVAAQVQDWDGWIYNSFLKKKVDGQYTRNLRAKLRGEPSDDWTWDLQWNVNAERSGAAWVSSNNVTGKFGGKLDGPALTNPFGDFEGNARRHWYGISLKNEVKFADGTLSVIGGYDQYAKRFFEELDFRNDKPITFFGTPFFPNGIQPIAQPVDLRAWTGEARYTSSDSAPIRWIAGAFVQDSLRKRVDDFGPLLFGAEASAFRTPTTQVAAFGQVTASLADQLEATLALRYDNVKTSEDMTGVTTKRRSDFAQKTFGQVQPKLSLAYNLSPQSIIYANMSRGFKPGGFNPQPGPTDTFKRIYKAETTTAIEVGAKTASADGRVSATASAFYTDYANFQYFAFINGNDTTYTAPKVKVKGFEFSVTAKPSPWLALDSALSYTDAKIGNFSAPNPVSGVGLRNYTGKQTPNSPRYNLATGAEVDWPLSGGLIGSVRGELTVRGKTFFEIDNALYSPTEAALNLRVAVRSDDWTAAIWAKNLTNNRWAVSAFGQGQIALLAFLGPNGPFDSFNINRGRQYGVTLKANF